MIDNFPPTRPGQVKHPRVIIALASHIMAYIKLCRQDKNPLSHKEKKMMAKAEEFLEAILSITEDF